jgi:hypothetical protein
MPGSNLFVCSVCGDRHPGPPMAWRSETPDPWPDDDARRPGDSRTPELCVLRSEGRRFVYGELQVPVAGGDGPLVFGVWAEVAEADFDRLVAAWDSPDRAGEIAGRLATELPPYPGSTGLEVALRVGPPQTSTVVVLPPADHPLARDQRQGIDRARVRTIAEVFLHG